jgi:hypothetical protein
MKSINYKSILLAVLACILTLFTIEQASRIYLFTTENFDHNSSHIRNPLYRRGWVEYTDKQENNTDHLIIIITGSQSWAPEIANEEDLYPNLLEMTLNQSPSETYTVLNWGVPGIDLPEYVILMSRLADYDPDLVFFLADWKDMTLNLSEPLKNYGTDVIRLAYFPEYRQHLSSSFLDKHDAHDPLQAIQNIFYMGVLHTYFMIDESAYWGHNIIEAVADRPYVTEQHKDLPHWSDEVDWYLANVMDTYLSSVGKTPLIAISPP